MKKIKLTQGKYALVDNEDYNYLNQFKWCYHSQYAMRRMYIKSTKGYKDIKMHRLIMNTPKHKETDHVDGNGLNNQKSNLRICTHKQNTQNARLRSDNKTGYKGVSISKRISGVVYVAKIANPKYKRTYSIHLGYFKTAQEAALAYNKAAIKQFGKYAYLNPI